VQRLPHGYTNDTRLDGSTVVKRYQGSDAGVRRYTERVVLSRLAGVDDQLIPPGCDHVIPPRLARGGCYLVFVVDWGTVRSGRLLGR